MAGRIDNRADSHVGDRVENRVEDPENIVEQFINITTSLSTEKSLNRLLNVVVSAAREITHADAGMVYLLDSKKRNLFIEVYQCGSVKENNFRFPSVSLYKSAEVGAERNTSNLVAYCTFMGQVRHIDDVSKYSGFDFSDVNNHDQNLGYKTQSLTAIPLRSHESITIGVLVLINFKNNSTGKITSFPKSLQGIVNAFAVQAAVAIDNVQLIERNKHLIDVLDNTNKALEQENEELRSTIQGKYDFSKIIGDSRAMKRVFSLMEKIIDSDATILLRGDTGTGKEVIAHALHYNSKRKNKQFVIQNCAALPENLLESELFGHKRGAFTGATNDKKGLIELADGGTLFLDEIGDMPIGLQAKILRVLQDRMVRPLGSTESKKINVRFVAATHCDLQAKIKKGEFREDLYYRLCVFPIELPSLKDRKEDLPALLHFFLKHFAEYYDKTIAGFSPAALEILLRYDFPGNVRDLRNVVERSVLMCEANGSILVDHLPEHLIELQSIGGDSKTNQPVSHLINSSLKDAVEVYEAACIQSKLEQCQWNQTKTANELKVARRTLIEKMNRYDISKNNSQTENVYKSG